MQGFLAGDLAHPTCGCVLDLGLQVQCCCLLPCFPCAAKAYHERLQSAKTIKDNIFEVTQPPAALGSGHRGAAHKCNLIA